MPASRLLIALSDSLVPCVHLLGISHLRAGCQRHCDSRASTFQGVYGLSTAGFLAVPGWGALPPIQDCVPVRVVHVSSHKERSDLHSGPHLQGKRMHGSLTHDSRARHQMDSGGGSQARGTEGLGSVHDSGIEVRRAGRAHRTSGKGVWRVWNLSGDVAGCSRPAPEGWPSILWG